MMPKNAKNRKASHHPKKRKARVVYKGNGKPKEIVLIPEKIEEQAKAIMQFPVSSGQQHRLTETCISPEAKNDLTPLPAFPTVSQTTTIFKKSNATLKEQKPTHITSTAIPPATTTTTAKTTEASSAASCAFPQILDKSYIFSKRFNAMKRLLINPSDKEAIKTMYYSQREVRFWAPSKHLPGQFTGSTGAKLLTPEELGTGYQNWARRDRFTATKPLTDGVGMHLLKKMGWSPGEGLGREKNGTLQPPLFDVKLDKRGLVSHEDYNGKILPMRLRGAVQNSQSTVKSPAEKHPVGLLNELAIKRKWKPPIYTLEDEEGPSHSKMFSFSVKVNGKTFTPKKASNTKKEAKMFAAKFCLEQIGILPKC